MFSHTFICIVFLSLLYTLIKETNVIGLLDACLVNLGRLAN